MCSSCRFEGKDGIKIPSSGMIFRVALVRTDVSEESFPFIINDIRIGELEKTLAVTSNRNMMQRNMYSHNDDGRDNLLRNVGFYKYYNA
jgi:hypothetical protein